MLGACGLDRGFGSVAAEWERQRSGPYYVVAVDEDRAVVSAKGRQVAIEPAEGFCLAEDAIETSRRSVFALIGDCALDANVDDAPRGKRGELHLPRGVPGIITVSVSGQIDMSSEDDRAGLEGFLKGPDGRSLLGRGENGSDAEVLETRRIGTGVYVLVDDSGSPEVPILDPRFWRGFIEVNDRLAVVTVSGFVEQPLGTEQMLKFLVNQMQTLAVANAEPINEDPQIMLAERLETGETGQVVALAELEPEPLTVTVTTPSENVGGPEAGPSIWPVPLSRPNRTRGAPQGIASAGTEAADPDEAATRYAPRQAPAAPRRPNRA